MSETKCGALTEISVTRWDPGISDFRWGYARLLTPEIEDMIRQHNVDTSDINCMKWPLFGLSRHATCKLLLTKEDLMDLIVARDATEWGNGADSLNGAPFTISFNTGHIDALDSCTYPRMWLADLIPLMTAEMGLTHTHPVTDEAGDPVIDPVTGEQMTEPRTEGIALYIAVFKCSRWKFAGRRAFGENRDQGSISWRDDTILQDSAKLTTSELVEYLLKGSWNTQGCLGSDGDFSRLANIKSSLFLNQVVVGDSSVGDAYQDTFSPSSLDPTDADCFGKFEWENTVPGVDAMAHRPAVEIIDWLLMKCGAAIVYEPIGSGEYGTYAFTIICVGKRIPTDSQLTEHYLDDNRCLSYLKQNNADILSGCRKTGTEDWEANSLTNRYERRIINASPIFNATYPLFRIDIKGANLPDGRPPDVFKTDLPQNTVTTSRQSYKLPNPFAQTDQFNAHSGLDFEHGREYCIQADSRYQKAIASTGDQEDHRNRKASPITFGNMNSPNTAGNEPRLAGTDVQIRRYEFLRFEAYRRHGGIADLWFRGWYSPTAKTTKISDPLLGGDGTTVIEIPGTIWSGGAWMELRLQTDRKGFGFPTTRIYGDLEDPLFCPMADDRPLEIKTSGIAKSWRASDGKINIHVPQPFGIPCLIKIVDNDGLFNTGVKAWSYLAKIVFKGKSFDSSTGQYPTPPSGSSWPGQLKDFGQIDENWSELTIVAYNLAELANTSSFSAPGYKMPLDQAGFDVLPIGKDRDGNQHEVIVQAHLYMSDGFDSNSTNPADMPVAYFCLPNAIDGSCT